MDKIKKILNKPNVGLKIVNKPPEKLENKGNPNIPNNKYKEIILKAFLQEKIVDIKDTTNV